jgi:NTE family protein
LGGLSRSRIGVALCGAELLGTVHVGVLMGLRRMGIQPDCIAGTSSGAIVAAMYACGYSDRDFERAIRKFPGLFLLDYGFPLCSSLTNVVLQPFVKKQRLPVPNGLFRGRKLLRYLERTVQGRDLSSLLYIVATDLYSTKPVVFTNDSDMIRNGRAVPIVHLCKEITGSCAIPGVFSPVKYGKWLLVDGGVRDLIPIRILLEAGCTKIIAVDLHRYAEDWHPITTIDVLTRSLQVLVEETSDVEKNDPNVLVLKPRPRKVTWLHRRGLRENAEIGQQYVLGLEAKIRAFLSTPPAHPRTTNVNPNDTRARVGLSIVIGHK